MSAKPNPAHILDGGIPVLPDVANVWPAASDVQRSSRGMRLSRQALFLLGLLAGCSDKESASNYEPQTARSRVVAALPNGWTGVDAGWQQQSDTTAYFNNPRTEAFALIGPQSRHGYSETKGQQQREDIFKECIFVWIVPGDFNPSFPKLPPAISMGITNIFSSRGVRVYAHVDNYIADTNRWQQLVNEMSTPGRGGSIRQPDPRVSWNSWVEDITAALKK